VFSTDTCWTWFNGRRAVWDAANQKCYVAGTRNDGVLDVRSFWNRSTYDYYDLGLPNGSSVFEIEDHDNPGLCLLNNGELFAGFSKHAVTDESYVARANGAGQVRNWNARVKVSAGAKNSYSEIIPLGDSNNTLVRFYRDDDDASKRKFRTSTDHGDTWSSANTLVNVPAGGARPYPQYEKNGSLRVDFFFSEDGPGETLTHCSLYAGYLLFNSDATSWTWHQLDGSVVAGPTTVDQFTLVYNGATNFGWCWDLKIINGQPHYAFVHFETSFTKHVLHWARWNGSSIDTEVVANVGDGTADYIGDGSSKPYAAGIALDPNNEGIVYPCIKYGANDFRLENWTHSGSYGSGSWAKSADVSGNTGTINARPFSLDCSGTTRVFWWEGTYATYTNFSTRGRCSPAFVKKNAKPTTPVYTSAYAPSGIKAWFLITEGNGAPGDLTGNGYGGALVGAPTWNTGGGSDFGKFLNGFSTSNYVSLNTLAAAIAFTSYDFWTLLLFKTTSASTTSQWSAGFGRNASANPIITVGNHNNGSTHQVEMLDRDDVPNSDDIITTGTGANGGFQNDGAYHVIFTRRTAANAFAMFFDGTSRGTGTVSLGTTTLDRGAIGCLVRTSAGSAFAGEVHAMAIGWGATVQDRCWMCEDWLFGQFSGSFDPNAGATGLSMVPERRRNRTLVRM
jgi:hypothetical protein